MSGEPTGAALCESVLRAVAARLVLANVVGAVFTFVYLETLAPVPGVDAASVTVDLIAFSVILAISIPAVGVTANRMAARAAGWIAEERPPTAVEREATLSLGIRTSFVPMIAWAGAALFYGVAEVATGQSGGEAVRIGISILDGGLVSCTIGYLLVERAFRPVFVRALAHEAPAGRLAAPGVRTRLVLTWALVSGVPLFGLAALPFQASRPGPDADITEAVLALSIAGIVTGAIATVAVARSVAEPLGEVRAALARVEAGDLEVRVTVDDAGEVGLLQAGVNQMVEGLRERSRLADLFGRHVGAEVAALALEQGTGMRSEQREASVLFVDLIGSTAMAEILAPDDVVETLNQYFATVVAVVAAHGGWVNKFEGDGALCVFGTPATQPDHAARALAAARALHDELTRLAVRCPGVDAAIGVSSGTVVAGNVGTEARYEYTVIGGPVNEANRLTDLAKDLPRRVLASGEAVARAGDEADNWAGRGTVALRGRVAPTAVAEPVPANETLPAG